MLKTIGKIIAIVLAVALIVVGIIFVPGEFETLDGALMLSSHTSAAPKLVAHRGLSALILKTLCLPLKVPRNMALTDMNLIYTQPKTVSGWLYTMTSLII